MMAICSRPALIGKHQKSIDCGAECEHQVQRFKDSKNWGRKSVGTTFLCGTVRFWPILLKKSNDNSTAEKYAPEIEI